MYYLIFMSCLDYDHISSLTTRTPMGRACRPERRPDAINNLQLQHRVVDCIDT